MFLILETKFLPHYLNKSIRYFIMDQNQFEMYLINKIKFFFNGLMIMIQNDQIKIINLFKIDSLIGIISEFVYLPRRN